MQRIFDPYLPRLTVVSAAGADLAEIEQNVGEALMPQQGRLLLPEELQEDDEGEGEIADEWPSDS